MFNIVNLGNKEFIFPKKNRKKLRDLRYSSKISHGSFSF